MKKSKFTDSQIIEALKRVEAGLAVPDLCREIRSSNGVGSRRPFVATTPRST
jgi:putative transposase